LSKKKLTKKKKRQLLAIFMTVGVMTNTFAGASVAFANTSTSSETNQAKTMRSVQTVNYTLLNDDRTGSTITSLYIDGEGKLNLNKTNSGLHASGYAIYGSNTSEFNLNSSENIGYMVIPDLYGNLDAMVSDKPVKDYPDYNYYFIVDYAYSSYPATPLVRINGAELGKNVDQSSLTANNATVEYGSTWNDTVAKQVTGVKATDKYGNDVTNNVTVTGNVDTKTTCKEVGNPKEIFFLWIQK
jgi:hypothetical protein